MLVLTQEGAFLPWKTQLSSADGVFNHYFSYLQITWFSLYNHGAWLMSSVLRPPREAGAQTWGEEDEDMAEGDLGYGLRRRPGGIYEGQVSHLLTSRRRSDETNLSPPAFPRKGEEGSGAVFQHSRPQDTYHEGSRTPHHRRHSSTGKNARPHFPLL